MKRTSFILLLAITSNTLMAQVDMYDITTHENVNINKNVNQNIHVGGAIYENKTITTIDYGALAEANANMQRLQFEQQQYADEKQRRIALEMAANPIKAYEYGHDLQITAYDRKIANDYGFKKFSYTYRIPHKDFFYRTGNERLENISSNGITTEIIIFSPYYNMYNVELLSKPDLSIIKEDTINEHLTADDTPIYVYKKALIKSTVFGYPGYKLTMIWEDDYQYCITDNYTSIFHTENGISFYVKVRTFGNKNEVTFEQLEGRRYYLRPLIEKVISTAHLDSGYKVCKTKKSGKDNRL